MAEIKIEKKSPVWPWILVVLIILGAIYYFWYNNDRNFDSEENLLQQDSISQLEEPRLNDNEVQDSKILYTGMYGTVKKEEAFADYLRFVDNLDNKSADKNYYRTAFFKLITATKRESEIKNVDVANNISAAMDSAEDLTNDPTATAKADNAKKAASEVSKALKTIQQKDFDNLSDNVKEVETAVTGIDGAKTLDNQSKNIDIFFDKAARLLQKMYESENNQ